MNKHYTMAIPPPSSSSGHPGQGQVLGVAIKSVMLRPNSMDSWSRWMNLSAPIQVACERRRGHLWQPGRFNKEQRDQTPDCPVAYCSFSLACFWRPWGKKPRGSRSRLGTQHMYLFLSPGLPFQTLPPYVQVLAHWPS